MKGADNYFKRFNKEYRNMRVSLRYTERKWKILALVVVLAVIWLIASNCTWVQAPIQNPVCDRTEFSGSWICERMHDNGIEAEHAWSIILDARDIGLILEKFGAEDVNRVCSKIIQYASGPSPTYAGLLELLKVETAKAQAIAGILSRHYGMFWDPALMVAADVRLINYAAEQLKIEMLLSKFEMDIDDDEILLLGGNDWNLIYDSN
jgi:hypothetical protein